MEAKTILVIEDNPQFQELLRQILGKAGYRILTADNGAEGLSLARAQRPDMVLVDVQMPLKDGYEVCRAIRAEPEIRRTPIIVISVLSRVGEVVEGLKSGADDYLNKPFNPDEVLARVNALFRQAAGPR